MSETLPQACVETDSFLVEFVYGEESAVPASAREHLATCERCGRELRELRSVREAAGTLPLEEPSSKLDDAVLAELDAHLGRTDPEPVKEPQRLKLVASNETTPAVKPPAKSRRWMWSSLAAAASVAVVAGGTLLLQQEQPFSASTVTLSGRASDGAAKGSAAAAPPATTQAWAGDKNLKSLAPAERPEPEFARPPPPASRATGFAEKTAQPNAGPAKDLGGLGALGHLGGAGSGGDQGPGPATRHMAGAGKRQADKLLPPRGDAQLFFGQNGGAPAPGGGVPTESARGAAVAQPESLSFGEATTVARPPPQVAATPPPAPPPPAVVAAPAPVLAPSPPVAASAPAPAPPPAARLEMPPADQSAFAADEDAARAEQVAKDDRAQAQKKRERQEEKSAEWDPGRLLAVGEAALQRGQYADAERTFGRVLAIADRPEWVTRRALSGHITALRALGRTAEAQRDEEALAERDAVATRKAAKAAKAKAAPPQAVDSVPVAEPAQAAPASE